MKAIDLSKNEVHRPAMPSREILQELMTSSYLLQLNFSILICKFLEAPLCFLPEFLLRWRVLEPMQLATQGSIDAACLALKHGWAINLAGGYHHANCKKGGGFCIYPDITMTVHYTRKWHGIKRVMIVDLDAHQGNGHERDMMKDEDVHIVDAYNPYIYPGDSFAERGIKTYIAVTNHDDDDSYLRKLKQEIPSAIKSFSPELIIYNAGTDCMTGDPLGRLDITPGGIKTMDLLMF